MRILHTSDWHLGKRIKEKDTYKGTQAFLKWLTNQIYEQHIDCLIVAGDIFDTTTPSNQAKAQYYQFIAGLAGSPCKSVVVIAGNHDSPSLLTAPKEVLKHLNVHVVGVATSELQDEVLEVRNARGEVGAIIGAVPFIRERDIYRSSEYDSATGRAPQVLDAIRGHFNSVYQLAVEKRMERQIPIVFTGHLFASEAEVADEEEREAYKVGTLEQIPLDVIPEEVAYVALGHIHRAQFLGDISRSYSGSPYLMNFKEVGQKKYVRVIEFPDGHASVESIEIPMFLNLEQVEGSVSFIIDKVKELVARNEEIIVKAVVDEDVYVGQDANKSIREVADGSLVSVVQVVPKARAISADSDEIDDTTFEMTTETVFERLLEVKNIPLDKREIYRSLYREILDTMDTLEEDR